MVKGKYLVRPGDVRAFCVRHSIRDEEIAERRGVTDSAINKVLNSDRTGRAVSQDLLMGVLQAACEVLRDREIRQVSARKVVS